MKGAVLERLFFGTKSARMDILGFEVSTLTLVFTAFFVWLIRYAFFGFDYFEKRGIPTEQPIKPLVGNIWNIWKEDKRSQMIAAVKNYGAVYGTFEGKNPVYMVSDPELIKGVTVKHADSFMDRRAFGTDQKYLRKALSILAGQEWKDVRSAVSPVFSTGKIKRMSALMEECCETLVKTAELRAAETDGLVEMKELFSGYTLNVIATCAFGTKIDCVTDAGGEFITRTKKIFRPPAFNTPLLLLPFMFPWVQKMGFKVFPSADINFYADLVKSIIQTRRSETTLQKRGDALDILIEVMDAEVEALKKDPTKTQVMTEEVLIGQCVLFFLAGFDTTGTLLTMAVYHLARNPDCQEKLLQEIFEQKEKHKGKIDHEMLADCEYLDQVVNETLRLSPPALRTERLCTRSCEVGDMKFKEGDLVAIPIYAIQHQEENYPNPEKFDPERFSPTNKGNIKPLTFLAFGNGMRNCLGMRFALEETKLALATMVDHFKLTYEPQSPLKLMPNTFQTNIDEAKIRIQSRK